ncbi:calcineurin-binding protein cabin-1-like [Ornithodoros turicata]|uniref:calcineurin-binding protein cabin-1-like n=1 Tax=Ornithodoros turicata TaxID=34597 RepID=UPI003138CB96
MIKFSALNSLDTSSTPNDDASPVITREAQEEAASELYRKALASLQAGQHEEARETFRELLAQPFVASCKPEDAEKSHIPISSGLLLKYLALKNLGGIEVTLGNVRAGVEAYLDAVEIDSTDVTVWHKIGTLALTLYLYPLARVAFQEGLKCSPRHWPCLSNLMTVLYVLNDYAGCLQLIAKVLQLEPKYIKALVLRDAIFREQPSFRTYCGSLFGDCDISTNSQLYSKEDEENVMQEAVSLRDKRREQYALKPLPVVPFTSKLSEITWKSLGEAIIKQYKYMSTASPETDISLACRVDLTDALDDPVKEDDTDMKEADSSQLTSGNSSGDLVINTDTPSDPTSQGESDAVPSQSAASDPPPPANLNPAPSLADQLTIITQEFLIPEEVTGTQVASGGRGRGGKRRKLSLEYLDPSLKRRSARVRNTLRKTQESVNFQELLMPFLPSSLQNDGKEDDREDSNPTLTDLNSDHTYGMTPNNSRQGEAERAARKGLNTTEPGDVRKFIEQHGKRCALFDVMYDYLYKLSVLDDLLWTEGLSDIYINMYNNLRTHIARPSIFAEEDEADDILHHTLSTLLYCEFMLDKVAEMKAQLAVSPALSPRSPANHLSPEFPVAEFQSDLEFLRQMSVRWTVFKERWLSVVLRSAWAEARFVTFNGETEAAVKILEDMLGRIEQENGSEAVRLVMTNCKMNNVITKEVIQEQLESLQRCQSLEEVHRLYELGRHQAVADLLIQTFRKPAARGRRVQAKTNIPERHAQLVLLQESLWNLKDFRGCLYWGEASLNEALHEYLTATTALTKQDWSNTIVIILSDVHRCIKQEASLLGSLDTVKLTRMAHNIIKLINIQMEVSDTCTDMPIPTVLPWNILYYVLKHEEDKIRSLATCNKLDGAEKAEDCASLSGTMPSSLMLLFTAHEYLGRRSWCTSSDGVLLFLCVDVMINEIKKPSPHPFYEDIVMGLEQCFYCLYGHPTRRGKVKHLQEHNATPVNLTWERSAVVFNFFKPAVLPEFDSLKTSTVSSELEVLLKRIAVQVPPEYDPSKMADAVVAYIEGAADSLPEPPGSVHHIVKNLYYLLGDYYFKNKEFVKAIRFYTLDVAINPSRKDSWAGLALSRSSQLEQRINSCEPKNEATILRRGTSSLRCFKRALDVDPANAALWIEYGSATYMLLSHISRQLKRSKQLGLSEETIESHSKKKKEYLSLAKTCYESANQCEADGLGNNEMWLNHYLLGKITHKAKEPPAIYLNHLYLSLQYLHRMNAKYPRKILYHSPPFLSIESLELYYKIHALCFKFLLKYEEKTAPKEDLEAVRMYLEKTSKSPIALFQERSSGAMSDYEDWEMLPLMKKRAKKRAVTGDHDYLEGANSGKVSSYQSRHRASTESMTEPEEVTVVKEILDSLVTVVTEKLMAEEKRGQPSASQGSAVTTIVLGDSPIRKRPAPTNEVICIDLTASDSRAELQRLIDGRRASVITHGAKNENPAAAASTAATADVTKQARPADVSESELKQVLLKMCVRAMRDCLSRFPQHFKSLYYLARYHCHSKHARNLQLSYEYLMHSGQGKSDISSPGLFAERKNTNFFTGIWHTPGDEIDRPGSFATHMKRSVVLLMEVLRLRRDVDKMVYVTVQLSRNPDLDKKYLRDTDRIYLAKKCFKQAMAIAQKELNDLMNEEPPPDESVLISGLLDVYKAWQSFQKAGVFVEEAGDVLSEAYKTFKLGEVDSSPPILEQALAFCSRHMARDAIAKSQESMMPKEWMTPEGFGMFGNFC